MDNYFSQLSDKCNGYKDLCAKFMKDEVFRIIGEIKKILRYTGLREIDIVPKYDENEIEKGEFVTEAEFIPFLKCKRWDNTYAVVVNDFIFKYNTKAYQEVLISLFLRFGYNIAFQYQRCTVHKITKDSNNVLFAGECGLCGHKVIL